MSIDLPENLKDFITYYLALREKAYIQRPKQEADEAGHCRSTHGGKGKRTYSLIADYDAWSKFRYIDQRLNTLRDNMRYYFNPDLEDITRLHHPKKKVEQGADLQKEKVS